MRVTYVSDNRTGSNWGCRATSIALSEVLEKKYPIQNTIYRDDKFRYVRTGSIFPPFVEKRIYRTGSAGLARKILRKLDVLCGFQSDYISLSPSESAKKFLALRNKSDVLERIHQKICDSDMIVINGEGDLIFNPNRRTVLFLLMLIELSYLKNIPVFFVNAMMSDCPKFGRDKNMVNAAIEALSKCSGISFRDNESVNLLHEIAPQIKSSYIPDALFSWTRYCSAENLMEIKYGSSIIPYPRDHLFGKYDFSVPYICLGGSSLAVRNFAAAVESYSKLATELSKLDYQVYIVDAGDGEFLEEVSKITNIPLIPIETPVLLGASILAKASLFISGRYHPSIMASLGGTPCIFLASNSHKTRSLQDVLGYQDVVEHSAIPSTEEISKIVDQAKNTLGLGIKERKRIQDKVLFLSDESQKIIPFIEMNFSRTDL